MPRPPYVELHAHSAFSFLDGASLPDEMAGAAAALGHGALAITDHDTLSGSMEFAHAATAAGIRPITGAEISISSQREGSPQSGVFHITLLVASARGYANLCRLITTAHAHTRSTRDRRAGDPLLPFAALQAHHEGLVCLSGCARHGLVPQLLAQGRQGDAEDALRRLMGIFGTGNTWVEIQRPATRGAKALARALEALAVSLGADGAAGTENEGAVEVGVYLDYMCPICGQFEETNGATLDQLREKLAGRCVLSTGVVERPEGRFRWKMTEVTA